MTKPPGVAELEQAVATAAMFRTETVYLQAPDARALLLAGVPDDLPDVEVEYESEQGTALITWVDGRSYHAPPAMGLAELEKDAKAAVALWQARRNEGER